MPFYVKKPIVIEARLFNGIDTEILDWLEQNGCPFEIGTACLSIVTLEGYMKASIGDYIIKGYSGEFYPCKPDIFEATYDSI